MRIGDVSECGVQNVQPDPFAMRVLKARLSGRWRVTPFFADSEVVAPVTILSLEERNALPSRG